jgi:adenosylmethionine-8-amino-7-oxononanoate aminotransferase
MQIGHNSYPGKVFHRRNPTLLPVVDRAEGVWIYDKSGKKYLDATGGAVVVGIGHGVREVLEAMREQAERICYSYSLQFTSEPQEQLAEELAAFAPGDLNRTFFSSGGSEAIETGIKIARDYFLATGKPGKHKVVGRWRAYHGNTMGALSASGNVGRRIPYCPYLLNFPHIAPPYCYRCFLGKKFPECALACADELERVIIQEGPSEIAAFIAEPIIGSSAPGVVPPDGYYQRIREICDKYDILFIADEILCGMGRTGKNFAIDHWNVVPDIVVTAKGLSCGYAPLGATIVREGVHSAIWTKSGEFPHGFTYGGNPLSCAVGLAVLRYIKTNRLVERSAVMGAYLLEKLKTELAPIGIVGDISGKGLLAGVELVRNRATREPFRKSDGISGKVVAAAFAQGVIILAGGGGQANGIDGDRLEIAPPFVSDHADIDVAISALKKALLGVDAEAKVG